MLAASGKFGELHYDEVYAISTATYVSLSLSLSHLPPAPKLNNDVKKLINEWRETQLLLGR